jgi:hypothetical protein
MFLLEQEPQESIYFAVLNVRHGALIWKISKTSTIFVIQTKCLYSVQYTLTAYAKPK